MCAMPNKPDTGVIQDIQQHRKWYIAEGILLVIIGFLAIFLPILTALAVQFIVGLLLVVHGLTQMILFFRRPRKRWWRLALSALALIAGFVMLFEPMSGLLALIIVVGAFLFVEGVHKVVLAIDFKPLKHWGWLLVSGLLSIMLSLFILFGFPYAGILYIAIAVGIALMLYGFSLTMVSWKGPKKLAS